MSTRLCHQKLVEKKILGTRRKIALYEMAGKRTEIGGNNYCQILYKLSNIERVHECFTTKGLEPRGVLPIVGNTERLRPKGVPLLSSQYIKG